MMKFRPQVESLSERINPDATVGATSVNYLQTLDNMQVVQATFTTQQVHDVLATIGYSTSATTSNPASNIPPNPLQTQIDELNKQFQELLDKANKLDKDRIAALATVAAYTNSYNAALNVYLAELKRLRDSGVPQDQLANHTSLQVAWKGVEAQAALLDAAKVTLQGIDAAIKANGEQMVIVFNELLLLGAQLIQQNPVPPTLP